MSPLVSSVVDWFTISTVEVLADEGPSPSPPPTWSFLGRGGDPKACQTRTPLQSVRVQVPEGCSIDQVYEFLTGSVLFYFF